MGNCWGTPVGNHHTPNSTNPNSPETLGKENVGRALSPPEKQRVVVAAAAAAAAAVEEEEEEEKKEPISPNLRVFTLAVLRTATRNFRPDTMLGEGGFGKVFKGWIDPKTYAPAKVGVGIPVAVKKSNPDSPQGLQEWQAEVKFLGKFSHPNLVKLLGYCWEEKQFLLVYEYMQKVSLENHLFRKGADPLSWEIRLKIAIGAARGLAFLHNSEKSVIYRDFKASNILLDWDYNAKLSDFGLAKFGPTDGSSHVTTRVIGTYGYAAPEYIATGHLYIKSDVYGFGVVLLEMLTGLPALDQNRPSGSHSLVEWTKPLLCEKRKLKKLIDPRLENRYPTKAVIHVAELILKCLEPDQKKRPSMHEVLISLEKINLIKEKPKEVKDRSTDREETSSSSHRHHGHHRSHNGGGSGGTRGREHRHPWPTVTNGENSI